MKIHINSIIETILYGNVEKADLSIIKEYLPDNLNDLDNEQLLRLKIAAYLKKTLDIEN
jgi:hypothetical protein